MESKRKPKVELSDYEYLELKEYDLKELNELFTFAIYQMCDEGILTPKETKEYLKNINKWLLEELEN